jgi:hypothetical protein
MRLPLLTAAFLQQEVDLLLRVLGEVVAARVVKLPHAQTRGQPPSVCRFTLRPTRVSRRPNLSLLIGSLLYDSDDRPYMTVPRFGKVTLTSSACLWLPSPWRALESSSAASTLVQAGRDTWGHPPESRGMDGVDLCPAAGDALTLTSREACVGVLRCAGDGARGVRGSVSELLGVVLGGAGGRNLPDRHDDERPPYLASLRLQGSVVLQE